MFSRADGFNFLFRAEKIPHSRAEPHPRAFRADLAPFSRAECCHGGFWADWARRRTCETEVREPHCVSINTKRELYSSLNFYTIYTLYAAKGIIQNLIALFSTSREGCSTRKLLQVCLHKYRIQPLLSLSL